MTDTPIDDRFLDALIKRSADAELLVWDCGRIRVLGAVKAAVQLYLDLGMLAQLSAGRTEVKGETTCQKL
jgi:hypothetical protein